MALSGVLSHLAEALSAGGGDTRKRMSDALRRLDHKNCGGTTRGTDKKGANPRDLNLKALLSQGEVEKDDIRVAGCSFGGRTCRARAGFISSLA